MKTLFSKGKLSGKCVLIFCFWAVTSQMLAQQPIVVTPKTAERCRGEYATFEVSVEGAVYQWQKFDGTTFKNIEGGEEVRREKYGANEAGSYRCELMISSVVYYSETATLIIHDRPQIGGIHVPAVCHGGVLKANAIDVDDNGSPLLNYEWRLNGFPVPGLPPMNNGNVPELTHTADDFENGWSIALTVTNDCGTSIAVREVIDIKSIPSPPTVVARDYCQYDDPMPLEVAGANEAVWYETNNPAEVGSSQAPIPNTNVVNSMQEWWVSQKVHYSEELACESNRAKVTVNILSLSDPPSITPVGPLCLSDPSPTFQVQGVDIRWYDGKKESLQTAPQINTSTTAPQTYYVTQKTAGKCESQKDAGAINVVVRDRSKVDDIILSSYTPDLCPNNSTSITVSSQGSNPTFRWYANQNKTGLFQVDFAASSTYVTALLMNDAVYYVSIEQDGLCESSYPKAIPIYVRDIELPEITAPGNIVFNTDPGECSASAVHVGWPVALKDNCTDSSNLKIFIYYDEVTYPVAPRYYPLGDTTLMWWARDDAGNMDYDLQNISIRDREKPTGNCPAEIIKEIDESEKSAVVHYDLNYTDNCSSVFYQLVSGFASGSDFPLGKTPVRHYIRDASGNVDTCEFNVVIRHPPRNMEVSIRVLSNNPICPGEEVVLSTVVSGGSGKNTYSWRPRAWSEPTLRDYPKVDIPYEVTVSDGDTTITKVAHIEVLKTRQVELTLKDRPMEEIFEGDEVVVSATSGFNIYKLQLNGETIQEAGVYNQISFQAELGTYVVRVFATDDNSCVTQHQMTIEIDSRKLPDVFTPNYDGINDVFLEFLEKKDAPEDFQLEVFTRAGILLYKGNKGWDGMYKGKMMPQGTYLYVVKRKMLSGEYWTFKGTVTLKL